MLRHAMMLHHHRALPVVHHLMMAHPVAHRHLRTHFGVHWHLLVFGAHPIGYGSFGHRGAPHVAHAAFRVPHAIRHLRASRRCESSYQGKSRDQFQSSHSEFSVVPRPGFLREAVTQKRGDNHKVFG